MMSGKKEGKDAKLSSVYRQAKPGAPAPTTPAKTTRAATKRQREDATPDPAVIARSNGEGATSRADLTVAEQALRKFDLQTKFGPCAGISRLERWERASKFGLNPPAEVRELILAAGGPGSEADKDLWHDRV